MDIIKDRINKQNSLQILGLAISICWIVTLSSSNVLITPYFVIFAVGVAAVIFNVYKNIKFHNNKHLISSVVFACIFMLCVTLANYNLWLENNCNFVSLLFLLLGSFFLAFNINVFTVNDVEPLFIKPKMHKYNSLFAFIVPFAVFMILNIYILFAAKFPGILSIDSISEVDSAINGITSNHHPYFHQLMIQFCLNIGINLFGSYNAGVAIYSILSVSFMSICFSLILYTLYQIKIPNLFITISFLFMLLMPYHINFMTIMWKDVFFGGFVVLICVYLYRCLKLIGNKYVNYAVICISTLGLILFRSNSIFAFLLFAVVAFILLWKHNKKLLILLCICFGLGLFLRFPAMEMMNIKQPKLGEALSIPIQQIARTYLEHNDFSEEQIGSLSQVMDVNQIRNKYNPNNADEIKSMLNSKNSTYLNQHLGDFVVLYFSGLIKHPDSYIKAWIDQTCGYWSAGHKPTTSFWISINSNKYNIRTECHDAALNSEIDNYFTLFNNDFLLIFKDIGFFSWIFLYLLFVCYTRKNWPVFLGVFLNLSVILSLLVSTPLCSEFRYAYCLFCSIPFLLWVAFFKDKDEVIK